LTEVPCDHPARDLFESYIAAYPKLTAKFKRYNEAQARCLVVGMACVREAQLRGDIFETGPPVAPGSKHLGGLETVLKFLVAAADCRRRTKKTK
jgi:hypothetical protein